MQKSFILRACGAALLVGTVLLVGALLRPVLTRLTVLTGVAVDDALANWRASARQRIIIAVLGFLLLLAVGIWLDLQLRRMHRNEARLSSEVWVDALTGIANRRAFDHRLSEALQDAVHTQAPLSVLMIDVDHFKLYNDTYGHVNGDACLRLIAGAIAGCARRSDDIAARYGGEEFAVVLPDTDAATAAKVLDEIRRRFAEIHYPAQPHDLSCTFSCGIAELTPDLDIKSMAKQADEALYVAKRGGRDRVEVFAGEA